MRRNEQDWEDARQEAWISFLTHKDRETVRSPEAWLKRVTYYNFVDIRRKQKREYEVLKKYFMQEINPDLLSEPIFLPSNKNTPIAPGAEAFQERRRENERRYSRSDKGKETRRRRDHKIAEAYRNRHQKIA